jgi:hypothetical protein
MRGDPTPIARWLFWMTPKRLADKTLSDGVQGVEAQSIRSFGHFPKPPSPAGASVGAASPSRG